MDASGSPRFALRCRQRWKRAPASIANGVFCKKVCTRLRELQERYGDIQLDDRSRTFNTELESALELGFMLDVAESMLQCALHRTESRGAHQRTDYPARDDSKFLAHSLVLRNSDGSFTG